MEVSRASARPWSAQDNRLHAAALARAKQAMADGYFLETISICEHLIADFLDADLAQALGRPRRKKPRLDALFREGNKKRPGGDSWYLFLSVKWWNRERMTQA